MKIIPASKRIGFGAFAVSAVAYSFGLGSAVQRPPTLIEGAGEQAPAALGSSFADLVEGVQEPVEADIKETEEVEPNTAEAVEPDVVDAPKPIPVHASEPTLVETETVETDQTGITLPVAVEAAASGADAMALTTVDTVQQAAMVPVDVMPTAPTPEAALNAPPEPTEPEPDMGEAVEVETSPQAPQASLRPPQMPSDEKRRVAQARAKPAPKPKPKTVPQAAPATTATKSQAKSQPTQKKGSAPQAAKKGASSGSAAGTAARTGGGGNKAQSGNAAMSNYGGKVLSRVQRRMPNNVRGKGLAKVSLSIGANGRLISAFLVQSSGNARIDKAALQAVKRASPFPKPPNGQTFTSIVGIRGID